MWKKIIYMHAVQKYKQIRSGVIKRNLSFLISLEDFEVWWNTTEDKCHYCGTTLKQYQDLVKRLNTQKYFKYPITLNLTVDRRDNKKGYEWGNIVKACYLCNTIKGFIMTEEEAIMICPVIIERLLLL